MLYFGTAIVYTRPIHFACLSSTKKAEVAARLLELTIFIGIRQQFATEKDIFLFGFVALFICFKIDEEVPKYFPKFYAGLRPH